MKNVNMDNFYFLETNKNNDSEKEVYYPFIRVIYSTQFYSVNNICIHIPLKIFKLEKNYDKYKCSFSVANNEDCIRFISQLEMTILKNSFNENYNQSKCPLYKLTEQINSGEIKAYHSDYHCDQFKTQQLILKISGIWSSFDVYGITYKYMYMKNIAH